MRQDGAADADDLPQVDSRSSTWIDARWGGPVAEMYGELALQQHRRFLKTHLPLDGLPYFPQVKYVIVGRDARDVFMSLWNHYSSYKDEFYTLLNSDPNLPGEPLPRCPEDIHDFWQQWISRGWFAWEEEGYPFWGNMHHAQSWWEYRHVDNLLFVHYADLLAQPQVEIGRIAYFLGIECTESTLQEIAEHTALPSMRQRGIERDIERQGHPIFRGGSNTFFNLGTNGRWRSLLSEEELAMYEETRAKVLTPECAAWLEKGQVSGSYETSAATAS